MAATATFTAEPRDQVGKGAARAVRRTGKVPGVIYGDGKAAVSLSMDKKELAMALNNPGFFNTICEVTVGKENYRVLPKDVQLHPVSDQALHIDFLRIGKNTKLHVDIPVVFEGEEQSRGLKAGGVLNIVRHEVAVICNPDDLPEALILDVSAGEIGDSLHVSAITLPKGVELQITDRDFTIATIAAPSVMPADDEEEDEAEGDEEDGAEEDGEDKEDE
ncbi:50S ribosomal protein L25/general stress protein Ctc [Alphaproteobacteria bacterium HT1-32]|nr:50S ribosomal protein L25/general stress protein Ctc [Alphaproteobacteria bacterium HT1-32]